MTASKQRRRPVMLVILDGFGWREDNADNAVRLAKTPTFTKLWEAGPRSFLRTSGKDVGLPDGVMGNSEVGHENIGAGRIVERSSLLLLDPRCTHPDLSNLFALEDVTARIEARVAAMLRDGLLDEVRQLQAAGFERNPSAARAIGYRESLAVLDGRLAERELATEIAKNTRALVKKQRTWFRTQLPPHRVVDASAARGEHELFPPGQ